MSGWRSKGDPFGQVDREMRAWVDEQIAESKAGFRAAAEGFEEVVRSQVPIGPPKRGANSPYHEGSLRESVEGVYDETGDRISATISVGSEEIDYLEYVRAQTGVDFFANASNAEENIDEVLGGGFISYEDPGG